MVCQSCGREQESGARFCGACGAQQAVAAPPFQAQGWTPQYAGAGWRPQARVQTNLQPLGVLWIVYGGYRLLALTFASMLLHTWARGSMFGVAPPFMLHAMRGFVPVIMFFGTLYAAAMMATGYGLLTRRPWARLTAIVMGILTLVKLPVGTALGIYTLWVLAPQTSGYEWNSLTGTHG